MRKLLFTIAILATFTFSANLPICEEFKGEKNITCLKGEKQAVIITTHADGSKTYEFFVGDKKAYIELGESKIYASSGLRHMDVAKIPAEDVERYVRDVFESVVEDIGF